MPSWLAVTTRAPSGLKAAEQPRWCGRGGAPALAGGGVPDAGGPVVAGGDDAGAVGAEGGRDNHVGVAAEERQLFAGGGVPDAGGAVDAGGDDAGAVGAEGGRGNPAVVAAEERQLFAGGGVPDAGGSVDAGGDDAGAVGAEGGRGNPSVWPRRAASSSPVAASQTRAVPSWLAVTTRVPSGLKAAELTALVWPSQER